MVNIDEKNNTSGPPFKWQQPKEHSVWLSNKAMKGWKASFFKTMLITVVCELIMYLILASFPLEAVGFNIQKALLFALLFALGFSLFGYLAGPYLERFYKKDYVVNEKRVASNAWHRWKHITSCNHPQKHEELDGIIFIQIEISYYREPQKLYFSKTQSDLANDVYDYIQQKISEQPHTAAMTQSWVRPSKKQHLKMLMLSLAIAIPLAFMPFNDFHNNYPWIATLIVLLFLLLGPGTWGITLLCKVRPLKNRDATRLMYLYNCLTLMLVSVFKIVMTMYGYLEILRQNT